MTTCELKKLTSKQHSMANIILAIIIIIGLIFCFASCNKFAVIGGAIVALSFITYFCVNWYQDKNYIKALSEKAAC